MNLVRVLRWPPPADAPFVLAAVGVWVGVAAATGHSPISVVPTVLVLCAVTGLVSTGRLPRYALVLVAAAVAAGVGAGVVDARRTIAVQTAPLPTEVVDVVAVVLDDPVVEPFGEALVADVLALRDDTGRVRSSRGRLVVRAPRLPAGPGQIVLVEGAVIRVRAGWHRGRPVTGSVTTDTVAVIGSLQPLHLEAGNTLRERVVDALDDRHTQAEALTRGFLIGDVSQLGSVEQEELRRSGLTHFVAVSGGNVALFLGGLWLLLMPLPLSAQIRAALGLGALVVFVVMTRWEPSVVRAAAMAGLVLVGKVLGLPVDPWRALGGGVAAVLLLAPRLAGSAGFHLSVAATTGLLLTAGIALDRRPRWLWRGLTAATAAQISVLPLLLVYFGTVPLAAPLANVVAAPLVAGATICAGVGVLAGVSFVVDLGVAVAEIVLDVARLAASGPQLGVFGVAVAIVIGALALVRATRLVGVAAAGSALLVALSSSTAAPPDSVTVLDVGQGDAVIITGGDGTVVAVDTGPDPVRYLAGLRRIGVEQIDLLVITHGDADHVGGAEGLLDRVQVGAIWAPRRDPPAPAVAELVAAAARRTVPVWSPAPGDVLEVGRIEIEVLGPLRRYDSENDESIVLWLAGPGRTMLLCGDIEAVAQRELPVLHPDVLLVPHHGSATSDLDWLRTTVGPLAVVSVGPNSYGHPAPQVIDLLVGLGVEVLTTQRQGDVVVPLGTMKSASVPVGMVGW